MSPNTKPGVFCLEGPWSANLTDESTVEPLLQLLKNRREIRYIHRDTATIEEFNEYATRWAQTQYDDYSFGYLAFHGSKAEISLGRSHISIDALGKTLEGKCAGRTIYFGSCKTLATSWEELEEFLARVRARAVCGYTEDIDWVQSAAFELNLLSTVPRSKRIDAGFLALQKGNGDTMNKLGFRALWANGRISPSTK